MFSLILKLIRLLSHSQRKQLFSLQILVVLMAISEVVGVASVGPFIALVSNPSLVNEHQLFARFYELSGFAEPDDFILWVGLAVLIILFGSAIISMLATWRLTLFSNKAGTELGARLYRYYMHQDWLFHASGNSAQLIKQIATETTRVTSQILNPLMQMNAKIVLSLVMLAGLMAFNPTVTLAAIVIFSLSYVFLYKIVRVRLAENGKRISEASAQRFKLLAEGFGGIKDLLILGQQQDFMLRFEAASKRLALSQAVNQTLGQAPRYFMELIAYSSIVLLILYLQKSYEGNLQQILPILAVYALAGFKLLPAIQNIYLSIASIRSGMAAFESVREALERSRRDADVINSAVRSRDPLQVKDCIELRNVSFAYPRKSDPVLRNLDLRIPVNKVVGLVGASGSGKSTAIDVLLGLIQPDMGQLVIDGKPMEARDLRSWQDSLGFVPQSIFLADASILENVALGVPREAIDIERVQCAIRLAHLDELVMSFPEGINTRVGERGVQLSGGQRQRIGIARALYHEAEILIFDEATSALDGITEKLIMDAIYDFAGSKTIVIIAHRLKTIEKCDIIYFLDQGKVVDFGTFDDLKNNNPIFRKMAEHA